MVETADIVAEVTDLYPDLEMEVAI